jgi:hypothetical protein
MKYLTPFIIFLGLFVSCSQSNVEKQIETQLNSELDSVLPYLNEKDLSKITHFDLKLGYSISGNRIIKPIDFGELDRNGILHYQDGSTLKPNSTEKPTMNSSSITTRNPTYASYRIVKSSAVKNFRGVLASVRTPSYPSFLTGIDQINEAAYDYVGMERNPTSVCNPLGYPPVPCGIDMGLDFNVEGGITIDSSHTSKPYVSIGGSRPSLGWSYGNHTSGEQYYLRLFIVSNNNIEFQFTNVPYNQSQSWSFYVPGTVSSGKNMIYRRNTALLADPVSATSINNYWYYVKLLKPSGNTNDYEEMASQFSNIGSTQTVGNVTYSSGAGSTETIDLRTP